MKRLLCYLLPLILLGAGLIVPSASAGKNGTDKAKPPPDRRLGKAKNLNSYFPFTPPRSLKEWKQRRSFLKAQVRVANGVWPLPEKTPLKPVVHGKIKRSGYTIEKVYFQSYPGFYVTGNLYRPTVIKKGAKVPGVLCPHGHWGNRSKPKVSGRLYAASEAAVDAQIKQKAEKTRAGAKYPLQARCAQLARLGCVVFHYDMIGYGDSTQFYHPLSNQNKKGYFTDPDAALWLQNNMGLQTWNSIRSLDFLTSLPEVDGKHIGVTGASGGGSQTFILAAVDERPTVAFPAVMVSTAMQGGCICENCTYLRLNSGNIELAGLFAPRPLAMSGADDWTREIEKKGLPQLKALYKLYDAEGNVAAKAWTQFKHNYNQHAREFMYNWFNKHLQLGHKGPIVERPFAPVAPQQLSVWNDEHKLPKTAATVHSLRDYMRTSAKKQLKKSFPKNAKMLKTFRAVTATALRVMMGEPTAPSAKMPIVSKDGLLSRKGAGEAVPFRLVQKTGKGNASTMVIWVHPDGQASLHKDGALIPQAKSIVKKGAGILAIDVFMTGKFKGAKYPQINKRYFGYTWGYNRTLLANRVHDIVTAVAYARSLPNVKKVHLVGVGAAGPWVAMARALCGQAVQRTAVDLNRFRFEEVLSLEDDNMQPGALKYGGLPAFTALIAPHELFVHNAQGVDPQGYLTAAYTASGQAKRLRRQMKKAQTQEMVNWVLR